MYFQRGAAWDAVSAFRKAWGITPVVAANYIEGDSESYPIFYPPNLPFMPPDSPFEPIDPDDRAGFIILPPGFRDGDVNQFHFSWYRDLKRMHDLIVPRECRSNLPIPEWSWITFLSMCAGTDPPPDQLIEYANSTVLMDLPPVTDPEAEIPDLETAQRAMIHAPILAIRDERDIEYAYIAFYERVFQQLAEAVMIEHGIDLRERRELLIVEQPKLFGGLSDALRDVSRRLVIRVDEYTTQEDVANALRLIRETNPPADDGEGRPSRDSLRAVQCAIWHDRFHWSHQQIAERYGWAIQYPPGQKSRSETARLYINEGRRIIQENAKP